MQEAEPATTSGQPPATPSTSSVYLNQPSPGGRHVTVIPINNIDKEEEDRDESVEYENHTYGAIFDFDEKNIEKGEKSKSEVESSQRKDKESAGSHKEKDLSTTKKEKDSNSPRKEKDSAAPRKEKESSSTPRKEKDSMWKESSSRKEQSPRRGRERSKARSGGGVGEPPPLPHRPVLRRLSERRRELAEGGQGGRGKVRRSSRRSSSLGPLLEGGLGDLGASTLSLESIDSNPRQAVPKAERGLGAVPRRQGPPPPAPAGGVEAGPPSPTHPLLGSPPRNMADLPPGIRPPPYHPLA